MKKEYKIIFEPLDQHVHNRLDFDCGSTELNNFLKTQAYQRQKKHNAVTHVAVNSEVILTPKIVYGFYTISNYCLEYSKLPRIDVKHISSKEKIPALKLGRLARNKLYTEPGFGEIILIEALRKTYSLSKEVGIYLLDVDILNSQLSAFYKKYGFKEFIDDQKHLFITIKTIEKLFISK